MTEGEIVKALQRAAERGVPGDVDLWPAIRTRLQQSAQVAGGGRLRAATLMAPAACLVILIAVSLWAARQSYRLPAPAEDLQAPGAAGAATYVAEEVFPDLALLTAASDLVVRGQALGPDRLAIAQVLVNRAGVDPQAVQLRLLQLPPDAPPLLNDPPLTTGQEYILFLRSFWGLHSSQFAAGDRTFRPVGGAQGQWPVQGGRVSQQADVPLKARSGEPVEQFAAAIAAAPDVRAAAASLLQQHGWAAGEPDRVRLEHLWTAEAMQSDAQLQACLAASQGIGLDLAPYAGRQVLWLHYVLDARGVQAAVLVADGRPIGAWLRSGQHGLVFGLDQRDEALAAAADPTIRPTPTPDPHPIGERANLAEHYRLAEASDMWIKGAVRGGLIRDGALLERIIAALGGETLVARVATLPPDDPQTVLVVFDRGEDRVAFRYHFDEGRVYESSEGNISFAPPPALVELLEPLIQPLVPQGAPTEAPAEPFAPMAE